MKRILMVDDSPVVVQAAYDELDGRGYIVEVAYNGRDAIKFLNENPNDLPHLIVLDIEMPKMKGDEAAKIIRDNPAWQYIPIIALTGTAPETMGNLLTLFNRYLVKPFGFNQLVELVERLIGKPE